ncbi:MAG: maleylpyruvate isomerase N-terminal domain-containing protein [Mycobacteriales bacterium]
MSEASDRYRRLAAHFTQRVCAVPPDRRDEPSPCQGWSTRDVLRHMIDNHRKMPVGADAPAYEQLLAHFGRRP